MVNVSSIKNVKVMLAGSCLLFSASCVVAEEAPPAPANTTTTTTTVTTTAAAGLTQGQKDAQAAANEALGVASTKIANAVTLVAGTKSETNSLKSLKLSGTELSTLQELDTLSVTLKNIGTKRLTNLDAAKQSLDNTDPKGVKQILAEAQSKLEAEIAKPDISAAAKSQLEKLLGEVKKKSGDATAQVTAIDAGKKAMEAELKALYGKLASLQTGIKDSVGSLPQPNADAPSLLKNQTKHMQQLEQALRLRQGFHQRWNGEGGYEKLQTLLDAAASTLPADERTALKDGIATALASANGAINQKCGHIGGWFGGLKGHCDGQVTELLAKYTQLHQDDLSAENRLITGREARLLVSAGTPMVAQLAAIQERWPSLAVQMEGNPEVNLLNIRAGFADLKTAALRHKAAIVSLEEWLAGDMTNFKADQVTLYYFGDVKRLMQALNREVDEFGSSGEFQERARNARNDLVKAELLVIEAENRVTNLQGRVVELREKERQARITFGAAQETLETANRQLARLTQRQSEANSLFTVADQEATNAPDDAAKKLAQLQAKGRLDELNTLVTSETTRNGEIQQTFLREKGVYESALNEREGLPAKIEEAMDALKLAQQDVRHLRAVAAMAVQEEVAAFAKARDNAPFLFAGSDGLSTDVARRVQMYAYTDSKTIFLRGTEQDLKEVRNIIAMFDRPAPQARLALWTLELNGDGSPKGYDKMSKVLQSVEDNLSDTRAQLAAAQSILRDAVNYQVNEVANETDNPYRELEDRQFNRYAFYNDEVLEQLGLTDDSKENGSEFLLKKFIPDPAGTTTLGETLMVLSLAKPEYQQKILKDFENRLQSPQIFAEKIGYEQPGEKDLRSVARRYPYPRNGNWFSSLYIALGISHEDTKTKDGKSFNQLKSSQDNLTPTQLEIVRALRRVTLSRVAKDIITDVKILKDKVRQSDVDTKAQFQSFVDTVSRDLNPQKYEHFRIELERWAIPQEILQQDMIHVIERSISAIQLLSEELGSTRQNTILHNLEYQKRILRENTTNLFLILTGLSSRDLLVEEKTEFIKTQIARYHPIESDVIIASLQEIATILEPLHSPITTNARVAAADEMLKRLIIAMEDDLDRHFVQPMLNDLRKDIRREGISVGILQRTTILATNRLVARVDPSATSQLEVGKETDVLEASKQLAQIYLAAQTAGASAVLGSLSSLPQEKAPELYGITTGSTFEVTPVIDPSGQALRFKFDYVHQSDIREPDGTVNPQLPRVRRHAVNTEVQLSNLEIRNISQFDTNYQLGIPKKVTGGIPLLNDIPLIKKIPLIGWFRRREGKAAQIQQSIILAQTTIYPTIGDITNLLTPPGAN